MAFIIDFFKRLFGLGVNNKPERSPADIIDAILADALAVNLLSLAGEGDAVTAHRIDFSHVERWFKEFPRGYLLSFLADNEQPRAFMVVPDAIMDGYVAAVTKAHPEAPRHENAALERCLGLLEGRLMGLFFMDGESKAGDFLRLKKTYAPEDREGLLWLAAGCSAVEAVHGDNRLLLLVDGDCEDRLKMAVQDPAFVSAVRAIVLTPATGGSEVVEDTVDEILISIVRPKEFVLGNLFLPVQVKDETFAVSSRYNRIIVNRDGGRYQGTGVLLYLVVDGTRYAIWYCFTNLAAGELEKAGVPFDSFFKAVLKESMMFLKSQCRKLQITSIRYQGGARPDTEDFGGHVVLCAAVTVNSLSLAAAVAVPREFLELLVPFFAHPWEYLYMNRSMKNLLLTALSLNQTMFYRGIRHFLKKYRGADAVIPAPLSCLPFYEFMDLVDDRDLKIIVQNFLVPRLADRYMALFNVQTLEDEDENGRPRSRITPVNADYQRLEKFLPRRIAEDEQARYVGTPREDFDRVNRDFMENLHRTVRSDRIVLSHKAEFILKNQFHDTVQENYISLLEELRRKGIPLSAMKTIGPRALAVAIGRLTNRDLALAVMGDPAGEQMVRTAMGEKRAAEFLQDREYLEKRYREGNITPEEAYRSVMAVQEELELAMRRRTSGA